MAVRLTELTADGLSLPLDHLDHNSLPIPLGASGLLSPKQTCPGLDPFSPFKTLCGTHPTVYPLFQTTPGGHPHSRSVFYFDINTSSPFHLLSLCNVFPGCIYIHYTGPSYPWYAPASFWETPLLTGYFDRVAKT